MQLPLAKGAYKRLDTPEIRLINCMFESNPTEAVSQVSLIQRPGLLTWKETEASAMRGMASADSGEGLGIFSVVANKLYGFTFSGGAYSVVSGIFGTKHCTLASLGVGISPGFSFILVITNQNNVYQYTDGVLSTLTFPDSAGATSVDVISSRFVFSRTSSQRFYWSDPNSSTVNALSYASAESRSDNLVCLKVLGDELWLHGIDSNEVWVPSSDPDLPFQRVTGRNFQYGCANRATVAVANSAMFFVGGADRRVFMIAPNPVPISDPAIEERLRKATVASLSGFAYSIGGHTVYVLNMGAQGTFAYDASTQQWHEWRSKGDISFRAQFAAPFGDGRYVVGGNAGRISFLDPATYQDNGDAITREWTGYLPTTERMRCDNVILNCSVGSSPSYVANPKVSLAYSDDGGKTLSSPIPASLGQAGDFSTPVSWYRLGMVNRPGRIFSFKCAENMPVTVLSASMNERF